MAMPIGIKKEVKHETEIRRITDESTESGV